MCAPAGIVWRKTPRGTVANTHLSAFSRRAENEYHVEWALHSVCLFLCERECMRMCFRRLFSHFLCNWFPPTERERKKDRYAVNIISMRWCEWVSRRACNPRNWFRSFNAALQKTTAPQVLLPKFWCKMPWLGRRDGCKYELRLKRWYHAVMCLPCHSHPQLFLCMEGSTEVFRFCTFKYLFFVLSSLQSSWKFNWWNVKNKLLDGYLTANAVDANLFSLKGARGIVHGLSRQESVWNPLKLALNSSARSRSVFLFYLFPHACLSSCLARSALRGPLPNLRVQFFTYHDHSAFSIRNCVS